MRNKKSYVLFLKYEFIVLKINFFRYKMDLVKEDQVQSALNQQQGRNVSLCSYEVAEFTQKCDNFTTDVFCVNATYTKDGEKHDTTLIVKVHPKISTPDLNHFYVKTFEKEGGFFFDLAPLLSTELSLVGQVNLRIPKACHLYTDSHRETLYLEDLRSKGYKSFGRTAPLDVAHTILIMQEYARLHGASMLLSKRSSRESLLTKFPFLANICSDRIIIKNMDEIFSGFLHGCADAAFKTSGYEAVGSKIMQIIPSVYSKMTKNMEPTPQFEAVIHMDCYSGNFLFK